VPQVYKGGAGGAAGAELSQERSWLGRGGGGGLGGSFNKTSRANGLVNTSVTVRHAASASVGGGAGSKSNSTSSYNGDPPRDMPREQIPASRFRERTHSGSIGKGVFETFRAALGLDA